MDVMMLFLTEMPKEARAKILFAALSLFTNKGFKNTSVLEIVEMARVSKTTFYQNFSTKEELMGVLFEEMAAEILEEVKKVIDQEARTAYKAYAGIHRYIEICFMDLKVASLMLVESVGVASSVEKVRNGAHRRFANLIFETVQSLLPKTVSEVEMRVVSQAMVGAINEVIVQNYSEAEDNTVDYEILARLLNRIVIGAFVHLAG
jgi:AcrR family transcriptional regulator